MNQEEKCKCHDEKEACKCQEECECHEEIKDEKKHKKDKKGDKYKEEFNRLLEANKKLEQDVLMAKADLINYRKRKDEEVVRMLKYSNEDLVKEMLSIIDSFERAIDIISHLPTSKIDFENEYIRLVKEKIIEKNTEVFRIR